LLAPSTAVEGGRVWNGLTNHQRGTIWSGWKSAILNVYENILGFKRGDNKMEARQKVIVTDFDRSFWRKAGFTIKREVAAIPAALILIIVGPIVMGILAMIIFHC
jgi:hypothetical protein